MSLSMNSSRTLRFAVGAKLVHVGTDEHPGKVEWHISKTDYLIGQLIGEALGLPYELIPSVDGELGRLLPDGNWTGMMGMVINGLADMAVALVPTEERTQALRFSYPHYFDQVTFLTQKHGVLSSTFAFLHPFSNNAWFALMLTFFIVSLVLYIILRGRYQYRMIIFNMIRSFLQQSWSINPVGFVENLMQMSWFVGTMLTSYFYMAVLLSFLTFPPRSGIKDISELSRAVSKGTHQCMSYSGSFIPHAIAKSKDESIRLIGQNLLKNQGSKSTSVEILQKKGTVFIGKRNGLHLLRDEYFMSEDNFFSAMAAPAYGETFCCAEKLRTVILRATAAGLFSKIVNNRLFIRFYPELIKMKGEKLVKKLTLDGVSGAFLVLILGHVASLFVFVLEVSSRRTRCMSCFICCNNSK